MKHCKFLVVGKLTWSNLRQSIRALIEPRISILRSIITVDVVLAAIKYKLGDTNFRGHAKEVIKWRWKINFSGRRGKDHWESNNRMAISLWWCASRILPTNDHLACSKSGYYTFKRKWRWIYLSISWYKILWPLYWYSLAGKDVPGLIREVDIHGVYWQKRLDKRANWGVWGRNYGFVHLRHIISQIEMALHKTDFGYKANTE